MFQMMFFVVNKVKLLGRNVLAKVVTDKDEQIKILKDGHSSNISAHSAQNKTYDKIREYFYWPNLSNDVPEWVSFISVTYVVNYHIQKI